MLLSDVVRLNGRKTPDKVAVVADDRVVTFGELRDRVNQVANSMLELGEPGDRIAVLWENLPEYVEMYYGVPTRTWSARRRRLNPSSTSTRTRRRGCCTRAERPAFRRVRC